MKDAALLSISKSGELAIRLNTVYLRRLCARRERWPSVPLSGGTPREVLDNVQDADWAADGENMAVVRFVPENSHWRLEYPIGKVLFDSINWISHPKISPDGKRVAFADHENPSGDDQGSVAVIEPDGNEKKLSSGWSSVEGILWSPAGDEIWFTASDSGSAANLRGRDSGRQGADDHQRAGRHVAAGCSRRNDADDYSPGPSRNSRPAARRKRRSANWDGSGGPCRET